MYKILIILRVSWRERVNVISLFHKSDEIRRERKRYYRTEKEKNYNENYYNSKRNTCVRRYISSSDTRARSRRAFSRVQFTALHCG